MPNYYLISLLLIVLAIAAFAMAFERRKPQARDLVIVAVLVAIAVASRAAFFMVPQVKPMIAIIIIAGVSLGAQSGFLVGALAGFLSNFIFGQGPWTPWQMFALGIIGFLAGILFRRSPLKTKRLPVCIFGGFSTLVLYGLIVDTSSAMMFTPRLSKEVLLTTYLAGLPFNAIHAVSTMIFLLILAKPMIEKLSRVKKKYGLVES
ncbi:MAG: ECF transporter S component [Clostridiales Family XIII bacterium]|jgi:energy-coupling factor transport system substrate-specific component|nr:ECF transporter S component [Clostridiales Family XIII bacterium]